MKTMILRAHTTWAAGLQQPTFSMSPSYFASSWSCCGGEKCDVSVWPISSLSTEVKGHTPFLGAASPQVALK